MASDRYKQTKRNGRKTRLHRAIMEEHLGRKLLTTEYVHHKNGDPMDNRLENLDVVNPVSHGRGHHLKYPLTKICVICGKEFTPHKTKRKRKQTCGAKECLSALLSLRQNG